MRQILSEGFAELGFPLTEDKENLFIKYYEHLSEKNAVMNLTAIKGEEDTARLHFLDCAALLKLYDFSNASVIDVGTGAGFPGIPLKILFPNLSLTLLDSHGKRVDFLTEVCDLLNFSDVRCVKARAEDVTNDFGYKFDVATSRAVARLNVLCELCLPFVRTGGVFIAMKGPDCADELKEAANAIRVLGGADPKIKSYTIPGTDIIHSAVIIKKTKLTPYGYPRAFGKIKNKPL